jgi:Putative transposase of IS4/5 family (DUF4096)
MHCYMCEDRCQWRQLPGDFPRWKSVHEHFRAWRDSGVWERIAQTLREQGRTAGGRNATPTVAIMDSQSAKTALKAYISMATSGFVTEDQRSIFKAVSHRLLEDQGAEAIMLGGTDLALAFNEQTAEFPLDCAVIHADAIGQLAIA